ncbi:MAG TPA: enoyl-ACP reductase [Fibrobacteraceae bacterium]|nr:enoyl-ACP reductase [Fibrobacteraceae bacterium]
MMMNGKKGIVFGVANQRSIAWGIAQKLMENGAEVAFSYFGDRLKGTLEKLLADKPNAKLYDCDASDESQIQATAERFKADFGSCDFIVHSIAFADKTYLEGEFLPTPKQVFLQAIDISAYTLVAITRAFEPILNPGSSIVALTYLGSQRVVLNYNVMGVAKATLEACVRYLANDLGPKGIRVNAISAGPVNTLAARGISDFTHLLKIHRKVAPLRANTTPEQVGGAGLFLLSELAVGVTGEILYVDGGYNTMAVGAMDAYNLATEPQKE